MKYEMVATTIFGLEAICADELRQLGFDNIEVQNGRVLFVCDAAGIAKSNLWLRTAERVYILAGEFEANDFDQLYDGIRELPLEWYLSKDSAFPVYAGSVKSKLTSLPAIQRVVKKAIVDNIRTAFKAEYFKEDGPVHAFNLNIINNRASLLIDTSGAGLHKRGYRQYGNVAPLKETLSAGLLSIARWRPEIPLIDPFCGSGTILIEAAMKRFNMPPGLNRNFSFENWAELGDTGIKKMKSEALDAARDRMEKDRDFRIEGYDIDPASIKQARLNAGKAGLSGIHLQVRDIKDFATSDRFGSIISNLPYGERLEDAKSAYKIYETLGGVMQGYPYWSKYFFTSHDGFEKGYGEKATKNRKLYNARIRAYFYQYYAQRPNK